MARSEISLTRLQLAYETLDRNGQLPHLPPGLSTAIIQEQINTHATALQDWNDTSASQSGSRAEAQEVLSLTRRLLVRVRSMLLAQYPRSSSALEAYGTLGATRDPRVSLQRLRVQAGVLRTAIAHGDVTVPSELAPDNLDAQALAHEKILVKRDGAIASRQGQSVRLKEAREKSMITLRRVRGIVIGMHGVSSLPDYGFELPAMPRRPRDAKPRKTKTKTAGSTERK